MRTGDIKIPLDNSNALMNRVRTGHTLARAHLKKVGSEDSDKCRHCDDASETIEHQLLFCPKLATELARYRRKYHQRFISHLNQALFDFNSKFMKKFLTKLKKAGGYV